MPIHRSVYEFKYNVATTTRKKLQKTFFTEPPHASELYRIDTPQQGAVLITLTSCFRVTGIHVIQSKVKKQGISPSWRIISSFAPGQILCGPAARIQTEENVVNFLRLHFIYLLFVVVITPFLDTKS